MNPKYVIGIDLGGTFIKGGAVLKDGEIISRSKKESGAKMGPHQPVINILKAAEQLWQNVGYPPEAVGFGIPGGISYEKGIVAESPHFPDWINFDLKSSLKEELNVPFVIDNDANAAAIGEGWLGAGRDVKNFCCITLGTGIGGGIVLNEAIWRGYLGMAGEVGHITVEPEGLPCACGGRGCLEVYSSATGIVKMAHEKYNNRDVSKRLRDITKGDPGEITPELLCKLAQEGDSLTKSIFEKMGKYLGISFANLINILNLELIIIGGGLLPAWEFFIEEAFSQMKMRTYKIPGERVQIVKAKCGNDAGLLGSAYMAWKGST